MSRYGDNVAPEADLCRPITSGPFTIGPANRMLMHWTYSGIVAVA